jgi:YQGE family putative transporter
MKRLAAEYRFFTSCSRDMRALLVANAIYALVLPVIEIFVAAYLLRNSRQATHVVLYQATVYLATPPAFFLNGYLLRVVPLNWMYAVGMLLTGGALIVLTHTNVRTASDIVASGGLMGLATGIFWANRGFLALAVTEEENRNYFYGVESTVLTMTSVLVPLAVGAWLAYALRHGTQGGGVDGAYRVIAGFACGLTLMAAAAMLRVQHRSQPVGRFLYLRFHALWRRLLLLTGLRGLTQGYMVTAPALLILRLVGQEGTLGTVEGVGSFVAAGCLYLIGRASKPQHRSTLFAVGLAIFLMGTLVNAWLFNALGVPAAGKAAVGGCVLPDPTARRGGAGGVGGTRSVCVPHEP